MVGVKDEMDNRGEERFEDMPAAVCGPQANLDMEELGHCCNIDLGGHGGAIQAIDVVRKGTGTAEGGVEVEHVFIRGARGRRGVPVGENERSKESAEG